MSRRYLLGWGCASDGQLGSTSTDVIVPRPFNDVPSSSIVDFSPGLWSSLIISTDTVFITQSANDGQTPFRQLAHGTATIPNFVSAAMGREFILLLSSTGGLFCIGSCAFGELGLGQRFFSVSNPTRIEMLSHLKIVDVAAAEFHWLALDSYGTVFSCGNNANGQLGLAHSDLVSIPSPVTALWPHPIVAISTGDGHSAALSADGNIFCFGSNKHGQLGNASFQIRVASLSPVPVSVPNSQTSSKPNSQLGKSNHHHKSHMSDFSESGLNTNSDMDIEPPLTESHKFFVDIACGSTHTVALQNDGSLLCWGQGDNGRLGTKTSRTQYEPTLVDIKERFVHVSAGQRHSAAVTIDGRAFMWGDGSSGQLGDGEVSDKYVPTELRPAQHSKHVPNWRFLRLKCGGSHSIGVLGDEQSEVYNAYMSRRNRLSRCSVDNMLQPKAGYSRFGSPSLLIYTFVCPELSHLSERKVDYIGAETAYLKFIRMFGDEGKFVLRKSAARIRREAQKAFGLIAEATMAGNSNIREDDSLSASFTTPKTMFDKNVRNFRSSVANSVECGYLFFIALMNPIYSDERCMADLGELAALILRCEEAARDAFLRMLSFCEENVILNRLIHPLQAILTNELKEYRRITRNAILATKMLALCYHGTMPEGRRKKSAGLISPKVFLNEIVSELVNFSEDYERWASREISRLENESTVKRNGKVGFELPPLPIAGVDDGAFAFCTYSFLLTKEAKFKILEIESKRVMSRESMRSLLSFGAGQIPSYRESSLLRMPVEQLTQLQFLVLFVRRNHIVADTYDQVAYLAQNHPRELRKPLKIIFDGEEGVDEGGVSKDFYQVLLERILSADYGMFELVEDSQFHWFRKDFLEPTASWQLLGILFGLALFNSILLDVQFPPVVYRKLIVAVRNSQMGKQAFSDDRSCLPESEKFAGYKPDLKDVFELFPSIGKSLQALREYEGDDIEDIFGLTFEVSYRNLFGKLINVELTANGANVAVSNLNKEKFINLYIEFLINSSIEDAFKPFATGFLFMLHGPFVKKLTADDLEALVTGEKELDLAGLRHGARYEGYEEGSPTITHFWQVLDEYDEPMKRLFLAFVTGTDRAPIGGLQRLKITIQRAGPDSVKLPTSRTCFNVLLLPEYGTRAKLRNRLSMAISNCAGFGLE